MYKRQVPLGDASTAGPFSLNLDLAGGAYFQLLKEGETPPSNIPTRDTTKAYGAIKLSGDVSGAINGSNIVIPGGTLGAKANANFKRK